MKNTIFRLLRVFLLIFAITASGVSSEAAKKRSSSASKAKTSQTAKSKTSSKSKKASSATTAKKSTAKKSTAKKSTVKKSTSRSNSKASTTTTRRRTRAVAAPVDAVAAPTQTTTATPARTGARPHLDSAADRAPAVDMASSESRRKIKVEKPDLEEIRRTTLDPSSKFYFPKLRQKYEKNDTTSMSPEDFRNFYLGYMFQEDYDPYRKSPYSSVTDELRMKPTHTKAEIDTIIKYSQLALEDNPFDLRQMSFLIHVLKESKKNMRAKIWEYRLENLLGAIKSTGTGDSTDNAWFVMYPAHEYDMVQLLGYEAVDADYIDPGYDYLAVQPDENDKRRRDKSAKGFYFNVVVPQQQYELKHPEIMTEATGAAAGNDDAAADELPADEAPATDPDELPAE